MSSQAQSFKNHARLDPAYHFFIAPIFFANLVIAIVDVVRHRDLHSAWFLLFSIAIVVLLFRVRQYPLKVQDRVIRLEERLRLQALAPAEWHSQIYRLSEAQLIGLRFASDDEVVELAKQALELNLSRKQIKERIKSWRADDWRV
jgi:hypothetical protein